MMQRPESSQAKEARPVSHPASPPDGQQDSSPASQRASRPNGHRDKASPLNIVLLGAGDRGSIYLAQVFRQMTGAVLVAIADPNAEKRRKIKERFGSGATQVAEHWEEIKPASLNRGAVIIATPDREHAAPAIAYLEDGWHVLLEKPMATGPAELEQLLEAEAVALRKGGSLTVCHVLRHSRFFRSLKEMTADPRMGKILSIYHAENVAWYHYAHSYVRGNWGKADDSCSFLLAKSSHDLDVLYWLAGELPHSVFSSRGEPWFTPDNAPAGAPGHCTDGCPHADNCPFESIRTYLYGIPLKQALAGQKGFTGLAARFMLAFPGLSSRLPFLRRYHYWKEWPSSTLGADRGPEAIMRALREGPYGRCVYRCGGDQSIRQETIVHFPSGLSAMFRLHGLSQQEGRSIRIEGTGGSIRARFGSGSEIEQRFTGTVGVRRIRFSQDYLGHREADEGLVRDWIRLIIGAGLADGSIGAQSAGLADGSIGAQSAGRESAVSHRLAFTAAESVERGCVLELPATGGIAGLPRTGGKS